MGDMKTPDFDDLLAAFDIPDIDTSEAIHSGHEETETHARPVPVEAGVPEHVLPHPDITTVSVIVKNTVCPEQLEPVDGRVKDGHPVGSRAVQNGFPGPEGPHTSPVSPAEAVVPANGECWALKEKAARSLDIFAPFGPDAPKEGEANLVDQSHSLPSDCPEPVQENLGSQPPAAFPPSFKKSPAGGIGLPLTPPPPPAALPVIKQEADCEVPCQESSAVRHPESSPPCYSAEMSPRVPWPVSTVTPESDLGSIPSIKHGLSSPQDHLFQSSSPDGGSPRPLVSPKHPSIGTLKEELVEKPVPCPPFAFSGEEEDGEEDGSTGSPSSSSSRPLKVRIKTIKTSSGSITRTVTRVPSDVEPGATKLPSEQNLQEGPAAHGGPLPTTVAEKEEVSAEIPSPKSMATSPMKVLEVPKVVSVQLGDGTKIKGTVLPVSTLQSASSAMLMAASVAQQKAVVLPGKAVAKNIISLVPQALPKAAEVRSAAVGQAVPPTASQKINGTTVVVMQPQKASPPMAGTVISRSQSGLVEAFNKILNSKNLLPPYKPNLLPPADASVSLPPLGYRCLECGDAFALEKSLARHYDRRSLRIEVTCSHCTKRLVFFNKCSLLLHAREHKDKGLIMQCSHLVMRPIALDQMIGQPDIAPLAALSTSKVAAPIAAESGVANGAAAQDQPVLPLNGSTEQSATNSCQCLECKEQCRDKAGLAAHFQQAGNTASTVCNSCPMIMANRCSFNAHQRMHKSRPPHVCPECGGNFLLANFDTHLRDACLHFSRRIGYRCPSCSVVFGGVNSIKSHIQSSHCEVFHKCPICPMAFKSAPSAHAHIYTQHPGFSNQQSKMIYKCAMCDTVFTHKPLLSSHFDQHLLIQRVSVFKCPECPLLFAQKRTMLEHLKNSHQHQKPKEELVRKPTATTPLTPQQEPPPPASKASSSSSSSSSSSEDEAPSSPELRKSKRGRFQRKVEMGGRSRSNGWTCGICHSWFPERDEYVVHMKKIHGKCVKKFPCHLCERSFCSAPSLRRHVRVNHEGIKRVYPCRYCMEGKRTFSSRLILEKHIQVRHGIKVTDATRSQEVLLTRLGARNSQVTGRKRKLSSDDGDSCSEEPDSTTPPSKSPRGDRRSLYHCRKCGYVAPTAADFQEHIPQHRTGESSHQCHECGLCFTSQVSLNRHRFITHKKKRGAGEAEGGAPQGVSEEGSPSAPEGSLSCTVCGKSFDTQLNLKTHFRTHGMAFIKARQTGGGEN